MEVKKDIKLGIATYTGETQVIETITNPLLAHGYDKVLESKGIGSNALDYFNSPVKIMSVQLKKGARLAALQLTTGRYLFDHDNSVFLLDGEFVEQFKELTPLEWYDLG